MIYYIGEIKWIDGFAIGFVGLVRMNWELEPEASMFSTEAYSILVRLFVTLDLGCVVTLDLMFGNKPISTIGCIWIIKVLCVWNKSVAYSGFIFLNK